MNKEYNSNSAGCQIAPAMTEETLKRLTVVCEELHGISDAILSRVERLSPIVHSPKGMISDRCPTQNGFFGSVDERIDSLHAVKDRLYTINENLSRITG